MKTEKTFDITDYDTILDYLSDNRIFSIDVVDGGVCITEGCDDCFSVELTKKQLVQLANELLIIANCCGDE